MSERINREWLDIIKMEKESPYVFRTRLERALRHTKRFAEKCNYSELVEFCDVIKSKLYYISDQSNQTSDGCLNSYRILVDKLTQMEKMTRPLKNG